MRARLGWWMVFTAAFLFLALGALTLQRDWQMKVPTQNGFKSSSPVDRLLSENEIDPMSGQVLLFSTLVMDEKGLTVALADRRRPFSERAQYAGQLALIGTPSAWRALMNLFLSESPTNQRTLALLLKKVSKKEFGKSLIKIVETANDWDVASAIRALGLLGGENNLMLLSSIVNDRGWPNHLRGEAARALLENGSEDQKRLSIRSMGAIGTEAETATLAKLLHDESQQQSLRIESAISLGKIASEKAGDELVAAFKEFADEEAQTVLLDSLGHFPFNQIGDTWQTFLDDPSTPLNLRTAAVEALANSSPDAVPYLMTLAAEDREPDVREMAAWALSMQESSEDLGGKIAAMIPRENEPDVRRRLYEGLLSQKTNPAASLLPTIDAEDDPASRIAGLNAIGDVIGRRASTPEVDQTFKAELVPELRAFALGDSSLNLRMRAVFALRRAGTPEAIEALRIISQSPTKEIATAANNGLNNQPRK